MRHHLEQNTHVRHRLDRYQAGHCLYYDDATPDALADLITQEIGRPVDYRPLETDGAARAAVRWTSSTAASAMTRGGRRE